MPVVAKRDVEPPPPRAVRVGFILKKSEQERGLSGFGRGFAPVKVPEQRLAGGPGFRVSLGAPDRPERRVIAFDAFVAWRHRFEDGKYLVARIALPIASGRAQRSGI